MKLNQSVLACGLVRSGMLSGGVPEVRAGIGVWCRQDSPVPNRCRSGATWTEGCDFSNR
jgi:hypothetical protein